jgi:hypothetical protein
MKTLLNHELKIQLVTILIFAVTFVKSFFSENGIFSQIMISAFFILAIVQYTLNIIKFFKGNFIKDESRKLYMFLSTFVVVGFLSWRLAFIFDWNDFENFSGMLALTWIFLTPFLIFQSLYISWCDSEDKIEDQDKISKNN